MLIGIAAVPEISTTARYFEAAASAAEYEVRRLPRIDVPDSLSGLDLLLVVDPFLRNPEALRAAPCPVAGYLIDVHQQLSMRLSYARYFDHVFVAQPDYLPHFERLPHASAHWLPLGCDVDVHYSPSQCRIHDVGFVGKLGYSGSERRAVLEYVLGQFETNDVTRFYHPREMGAVYSRSKVVFNKSINGDVNMRLFEALAAGALLVTDRIANGLDCIGQDGVHFVTYTSAEDAVDKISFYLSHDADRKAIAAEGQRHVFANHTYGHRLAAIIDVVRRATGLRSPARSASGRIEAMWRSECMIYEGASPSAVGRLMLEGNLSGRFMRNAAMAVARGIVRPLRRAVALRRLNK